MPARALGLLILACVGAPTLAAPVTFERAAEQVLAAAPRLRAADAGLRSVQAAEQQASRRPNPSLEVEVENFGGSRPYDGFDGAEITAVVEQPIELGGKRRSRLDQARADTRLATAELAAARRRLLADLVAAYAAAAAARERLAIRSDQAEAARTIATQSARRLAVGDIPDVQNDRTQVDLGSADAAFEQARIDLDAAERTLATLWSGDSSAEANADWLSDIGPDPARVATRLSADDLPDMARWAAIEARGRAVIAGARAARMPDVGVRAGVRSLRDDDATAFVAGLSVPLPLFDGGGARVESARQEAARASFEVAAERAEALRDLARAMGSWRGARASLDVVDRQTLPAAERLVTLTRRGFDGGVLPYRDLADALTARLSARLQRVEALEKVQVARGEVAALTGGFAEVGWPALESLAVGSR